MRGSLHARSLHGDLPSRSGSYVRSRTSQFLENNVMVVLVLLLLFCSAASAVDVKPTTSSSLYDLCQNDSICAGRFYLESSASLYGLQLFRRLLDEHLSSMVGTSSSLETVPTISDANTSAWWWLSLLRTARFCDGKANREFRLGFGCTLIEGKHDDDDVDPTKFTWDYVTIDILVVVVIAVIMYYTYTVIDQLSATRFALTDFSGRFVPPVPQKPQVSVISFPR